MEQKEDQSHTIKEDKGLCRPLEWRVYSSWRQVWVEVEADDGGEQGRELGWWWRWARKPEEASIWR